MKLWRWLLAFLFGPPRDEDAYWLDIANSILEQNPDADVSFCFRRNRPPYRCPIAPEEPQA